MCYSDETSLKRTSVKIKISFQVKKNNKISSYSAMIQMIVHHYNSPTAILAFLSVRQPKTRKEIMSFKALKNNNC
jgi:hypothetical protein